MVTIPKIRDKNITVGFRVHISVRSRSSFKKREMVESQQALQIIKVRSGDFRRESK